MDLIRNSSIRVFRGGPRNGGKKETKITNTAKKRPAQECSANVTFGEDDVTDASALNATFGEDDVTDASALNATFGEDDVTDASALNVTFGEDDVTDASALNVTFGEDDVTDASALNVTFGEDDVADASALNSTHTYSTSAMEAIDDIDEDEHSQKSESSLQVLYRVVASGIFGYVYPVDTASYKHLPPKEEVMGTSMNNDISQISGVSYLSDLTLTHASDNAKDTGTTDFCCGVFSQWS